MVYVVFIFRVGECLYKPPDRSENLLASPELDHGVERGLPSLKLHSLVRNNHLVVTLLLIKRGIEMKMTLS